MKKRCIRIMALLLGMLLSVSLVSATFTETIKAEETATLAKIDAEVWETEPDENGYRLIGVWRKDIDASQKENRFYEKYGFDMSDYEDKSVYESKIVSKLTENFYRNSNNEISAKRIIADNKTDEEREKQLEEIIREDYQTFVTKKRTVTTELYGEYNNKFVEDLSINQNLIIYQSKYTGTIVLRATEDQIKSLARDSSVEEITYWHNYKPVVETCTINKQIGSDAVTGTKSSNYNNGNGYFGTGVKIGIIEAESGRYDPDIFQLKDIPESHLKYIPSENDNGDTLSPKKSAHATLITSIIVGAGYAYDGIEFESVAPGATFIKWQ